MYDKFNNNSNRHKEGKCVLKYQIICVIYELPTSLINETNSLVNENSFHRISCNGQDIAYSPVYSWRV